MRECFVEKNFQDSSLELIERSNAILEEYADQGYSMTLRQVYYQLVARGYIPNSQSSYKRVGSILNDARLAGLVDWEHMEDRTRNLQRNPHWGTPADIIHSAAYSFAVDKWRNQEYRIEVWVEKEALAGVIAPVCERLDIDYFPCRGYTSQSEMYEAGNRLGRYAGYGQTPVILHLGDHDPSGIDMTRDVIERLEMFSGLEIEVDRLALNMDQVRRYDPPPNPAKITDSRAQGYIREFGRSSWELDALSPTIIDDLISAAVLQLRDDELWDEAVAEEQAGKEALQIAASHWFEVAEWIEQKYK